MVGVRIDAAGRRAADAQAAGGRSRLERGDRRLAVADLHDGERRRCARAPCVTISLAISGCFESVETRSRMSVSESSSGGRSTFSALWPLARRAATSVDVAVAGGVVAVGCARLIHHSVSTSADDDGAGADHHPAQGRRLGRAMRHAPRGGRGRRAIVRSSRFGSSMDYCNDRPRPVPAFEAATVHRLDGDLRARRQRRQGRRRGASRSRACAADRRAGP